MRCCNRLRLAGRTSSSYCDKPAVGCIVSETEVREGWVIKSQLPVCEHCYQLRTGQRWVTVDQLNMLVS